MALGDCSAVIGSDNLAWIGWRDFIQTLDFEINRTSEYRRNQIRDGDPLSPGGDVAAQIFGGVGPRHQDEAAVGQKDVPSVPLGDPVAVVGDGHLAKIDGRNLTKTLNLQVRRAADDGKNLV